MQAIRPRESVPLADLGETPGATPQAVAHLQVAAYLWDGSIEDFCDAALEALLSMGDVL
jgi:hypothetical protein